MTSMIEATPALTAYCLIWAAAMVFLATGLAGYHLWRWWRSRQPHYTGGDR